jgi:hypothetical protein
MHRFKGNWEMSNKFDRVAEEQANLFFTTAKQVQSLGGGVQMSFRGHHPDTTHLLRFMPAGDVNVTTFVGYKVFAFEEKYRTLEDFAAVYKLTKND